MKKVPVLITFVVVLIIGGYLVFYDDNTKDVEVNPSKNPETVTVDVSGGLERESLGSLMADKLSWSESQVNRFTDALKGTQWDSFNDLLVLFLENNHEWEEEKIEVFLTHSSEFLSFEPDVVEFLYYPGAYEFSDDISPAEAAELLVDKVYAEVPYIMDFIESRISSNKVSEIENYINEQLELRPDLIPLPPQDVGLREEGGNTLLVFSTTYYNVGDGNLELIPDPEKSDVEGDVERTIFQRIERRDGTERFYEVGNFLWKEEHMHYHYSDFAEYVLEPIPESDIEDQERLVEKATFCIRDSTQIELEGQATSTEANYKICGKEKQGITVGWGDTYFQTYDSQSFNITNVPSGTYKLSFFINPEDRFLEITKKNNESSALIEIDKEAGSVDVLELSPEDYPSFEYIYPD